MSTGNSTSNRTPSGNKAENTLVRLFSSDDCAEYFRNLSKITGFDLCVYDGDGRPVFDVRYGPVCELIKSSASVILECPASCRNFILKQLKSDEPAIHKCTSRVVSFAIPVTYLKEKAVIVGRNGFASYEDFLEFMDIARKNNFREIPVKTPLDFVDEHYIKSISLYIQRAASYILNNFQDKHKLVEKLGRFSSLVDFNILNKISRDISSVHRYIIDTVLFILGPKSVAMLTLDDTTGTYRTVHASGRHKNILNNIQIHKDNANIKEMISARPAVLPVDLEAERIITAVHGEKLDTLNLFPIFTSNTLEALIVIFDNELAPEDMKIISALCDFIEVTLENHALQHSIDQKMDDVLSSFSDLSRSLVSVPNWGQLLQTILEKSTQLLRAEQGSLMLLNKETSELLVEAKKSIDDIVIDSMKGRIGEGIAGRVFESGEPLLVRDVENDPRIHQKNKPRYRTKSFLSIPLKIDNRVTAVLNLSDKITGEDFDENDLKLIQSFTPNAALAIERRSLNEKIHSLEKLSLTDPLTGILNRRYLNERLAEEISRFRRYKHSFSFMMVDVDGFKYYNDTFGHMTGDKVLKSLAGTISSSLRNIDIVARFGGDEFVVILPQTPKEDAINIGNRVKENVEKTPIADQCGIPPSNLTVSIGLSCFPDDASSIAELFEKTDQALYLAKKGGRNKLVYL